MLNHFMLQMNKVLFHFQKFSKQSFQLNLEKKFLTTHRILLEKAPTSGKYLARHPNIRLSVQYSDYPSCLGQLRLLPSQCHHHQQHHCRKQLNPQALLPTRVYIIGCFKSCITTDWQLLEQVSVFLKLNISLRV